MPLSHAEQEAFSNYRYCIQSRIPGQELTIYRCGKPPRDCVRLPKRRIAELEEEGILYLLYTNYGRIYKIQAEARRKAKRDVLARAQLLETTRGKATDTLKYSLKLPRALADRLMLATGQTNLSRAVEKMIEHQLAQATYPVIATPHGLNATQQGELADKVARTWPWVYGVAFTTLARLPLPTLRGILRLARGSGYHYYSEFDLDVAAEAFRADLRDVLKCREVFFRASAPSHSRDSEIEAPTLSMQAETADQTA